MNIKGGRDKQEECEGGHEYHVVWIMLYKMISW